MVTYVLDASAILRYLDGEAGADRVTQIIKFHIASTHRVAVSAIHWGEVAGILFKRHGPEKSAAAISKLNGLRFDLIDATPERAIRSAIIKVNYKIPYADAFGVELAGNSSDHILITADYDVKPAESDVQIEFLAIKPNA